MIINMDNKTTLQLAIEKRDSLVKLNEKLEHNFNISSNRTIVSFFLTALASVFFRHSASSDDKVDSFFGIIGMTVSIALGLYFIFKAYNVSSYKYYLDIFDEDDLALIKSNANLYYHFERLLKIDGKGQYVQGRFQKEVVQKINEIKERIDYLELFEQSGSVKSEMINEVLNSKRFENFKSAKNNH